MRATSILIWLCRILENNENTIIIQKILVVLVQHYSTSKHWPNTQFHKVEGVKVVTLSVEYKSYYHIWNKLKYLLLAIEMGVQRTKVCLLDICTQKSEGFISLLADQSKTVT